MPTILIHGGRVIDPASELDATGDVLLEDGTVAAIATTPGKLSRADADQSIDAEGCIVSPGLIDLHVHLREPDNEVARSKVPRHSASGAGAEQIDSVSAVEHPDAECRGTGYADAPRQPSQAGSDDQSARRGASGYRTHEETIASGSAAAINGGFTTVCCMPNTRPALDSPEMIRFVQKQAEAAGMARVFAVGCATIGRHGEHVAPIAAMADAGAVAFSDDGDVVADAAIMAEVLRQSAAVDRCFMQHCQEPSLTRGASMNAGEVATRLGQIGWPAVAEELIIERDVRLNRESRCRYHAQHLSSGESAAILRQARAAGQPVSGEVSPHHLLLTDQACETLGPLAKMNPPLRSQRDIDLLKQAVAEGVITVLATDHAPHPMASKQVPFAEASFGIVGVECALPLYARALIGDGVLDWPAMLRMMTIAPARLVGLDRLGLGMLRVGGPADVTIIDPQLTWTINAADFASHGRNCPFDGWRVAGRAVASVVGGAVRMLRPERLSSAAGKN